MKLAISNLKLESIRIFFVGSQLISETMISRKMRNSQQSVFKYGERKLQHMTQKPRLVIAELVALQSSRQLRQKGAE